MISIKNFIVGFLMALGVFMIGYKLGYDGKTQYNVINYGDTVRIPICFINETWSRCFDKEEALIVEYVLDGKYFTLPKIVIFTNNQTWRVDPSFSD